MRHIFVTGLIAAACVAAPTTALAQTKPAGVKARVVAGVEARAKLAQVINDMLFSYAELGFQETEAAEYLTTMLAKEGFTIERNIAGMPSGWVARWTHGQGGPTIGLVSDVDGIPKASQKPGIPWRDPLIAGAPGHGEGHNSSPAVNVAAALAVKEQMIRENIPGTLVLVPGVAEEMGAGKPFFVRAGVFNKMDAVIFTHVGPTFETSWGQPLGTANVSVEYSFRGESAHGASSPWRGKSALDAVMLMANGWEFRREHLHPDQRSHYVITDGGDQPNVVPQTGSIWFYIRDIMPEGVKRNAAIADAIAEGAAKMTDTVVTRRVLGAAERRHFNKALAEATYANIRAVGLPQWDADDHAFARAVQVSANVPNPQGLATQLPELKPPAAHPGSGGSSDIGDVAWTVPTVKLTYPSNIPGLPNHSWLAATAMATPIAHKGVVAGAKVTAMTMIDILTKPAVLKEARAYFTNVQTKDSKYTPLIGEKDEPQIQINSATMERFRPELRKIYYQPERYNTYLEQLGIKWPTLTKDASKQ